MHFIATSTLLDCCQQGELLIADCYKMLLELSDAQGSAHVQAAGH